MAKHKVYGRWMMLCVHVECGILFVFCYFVVIFTSIRSKFHSKDLWPQLIVSVNSKQILFALRPQQQPTPTKTTIQIYARYIVSNSNVPMHEINQKSNKPFMKWLSFASFQMNYVAGG